MFYNEKGFAQKCVMYCRQLLPHQHKRRGIQYPWKMETKKTNSAGQKVIRGEMGGAQLIEVSS